MSKNKKGWAHLSKAAKVGILLPTSLVSTGAVTVGVLYATHVLGDSATNINTIFGNSLAWVDADGYGTQANPLATEPKNSQNNAMTISYLNWWLTNNGHTADVNVLNDLTFTFPVTPVDDGSAENTIGVGVKPNTTSYTGTFNLTYWCSLSHNLSVVVTNTTVDYSSIKDTAKSIEVLNTLYSQNTGLSINQVDIKEFPNITDVISASTASSYWNDIGSGVYAYKLILEGKTGGWYDGQQIEINVKLQRTSLTTLFGTSPTISEQFFIAPSLPQMTERWVSQYSGQSWYVAFAGLTYGNFTNNGGDLKLTYADGNALYAPGEITFTVNVLQPTALTSVFVSNSGALITTAGAFNSPPTATAEGWSDVLWNLKQLYTSPDYDNFLGADFTSMRVTNVTANQITISPIAGSLWYSGTVVLSYTLNPTS